MISIGVLGTVASKPLRLTLVAPNHAQYRLIGAPQLRFEEQVVTWQGVPLDDLQDLELEAAVFALRPRSVEQGGKFDGKTLWPSCASMFTGDAVKPAFATAGDLKILRVIERREPSLRTDS
jgi:hypothetical protein